MTTETPATFDIPAAFELEVKGEVLASNFEAFKAAIEIGLGNINMNPETDEDFGQSEQDVKTLKQVEDMVRSGKEEALKQAESLQKFFAELEDCAELCRAQRLELEKLIKTKKEEIKGEIISNAISKIDSVHRNDFRSKVTEAIKGKRNLSSMRMAASKEVTTINGIIHQAQEIIDSFAESHGEELVMGRTRLELVGAEALKIELQNRVEKKALAEKKRLAEEEAAKARAEAEEAKKQSAPVEVKTESVAQAVPESATNTTPAADMVDSAAEWVEFKQVFIGAFAPIKEARAKLKDAGNIAKAEMLANAINEAWKGLA